MHNLRVLSLCTFALLTCLLLIAGCTPSVPDKEPVSIDMSESSYEPMNEFVKDFQAAFSESSHEDLSEKPIDELFPAEEIPADKLSWFLEGKEDVTVYACKGIRFNNGDILIAFFYEAEVPDDTVISYITIDIEMYGSPLIPPPNIHEYTGGSAVGDGFGVIAYSFSESEMDQLLIDIAFEAKYNDDLLSKPS